MSDNEGGGCDGEGEERVYMDRLESRKRTLMMMMKKLDVGGYELSCSVDRCEMVLRRWCE